MDSNSILNSIEKPSDLRNLGADDLNSLCQEIRTRIISATSKNGGHVGPNLGVVELTVALHLVFETPQDSLCWDVSHQGYVHKLLTGRNDERFDLLRQSNGLSGFLSREESPHDAFGAGHAGTCLSAALGMCVARDQKGEQNHVVAIAGDAAFTCGITLEALNNIAETTKKFILVLNDNEWSIAKNVGALSKYFNELITTPVYGKIHKDAESILSQIPGGQSFMKIVSKAKRDTKDLIGRSSIFEKLGLRYIGPIDGHDIDSMVRFFEFAKESDEPIVLHLITEKGKGYPEAQKEPEKWHGAGPFDSKTGKSIGSSESKPKKFQDVFGQTLCELAHQNDSIIGITAAMPSGTGMDKLGQNFPDRFFDVGIAEEHAVLMAAGMASKGFIPICAIYSTFLQRAYDPIIHDVCLQNLPVVFCLDRAGLSPNDGPTHHGLFDLSYLRCIPNALVMQPRDENELREMLFTSVSANRPCFIRYPRGHGTGVDLSPQPKSLEIGHAQIITKGNDGAIWALGNFVEDAIWLSETLKEKFDLDCTVVNARFVKPLDEKLLVQHAKEHQFIISMEDNVLNGGFGSAMLEKLQENNIYIPFKRIGWPDKFIPHGDSVSTLREKFGLSRIGILEQTQLFLNQSQDRMNPVLV